MKDELIALYYQLPECCNKIQHKSLERILTAKISNSQQNYYYFFFLCIYEMALLSEQGYINTGVKTLKIRKTDEIWVNMQHVGDGLNVKNISDLVLKEIHGVYGKKINKRRY